MEQARKKLGEISAPLQADQSTTNAHLHDYLLPATGARALIVLRPAVKPARGEVGTQAGHLSQLASLEPSRPELFPQAMSPLLQTFLGRGGGLCLPLIQRPAWLPNKTLCVFQVSPNPVSLVGLASHK